MMLSTARCASFSKPVKRVSNGLWKILKCRLAAVEPDISSEFVRFSGNLTFPDDIIHLKLRNEEMTLSDHPIGASYLYLLEPEVRFLEAAVEHLIPTDELGAGARDAGVVVYIDRQLAGSWGVHGRMYRGGPWLEGTPQQGYQSRFTARGAMPTPSAALPVSA